jgi:hypothetical protein
MIMKQEFPPCSRLQRGQSPCPNWCPRLAWLVVEFAENSIVVAEGVLQTSGVFKVAALGLPPAEPKAESLKALQASRHPSLAVGLLQP